MYAMVERERDERLAAEKHVYRVRFFKRGLIGAGCVLAVGLLLFAASEVLR